MRLGTAATLVYGALAGLCAETVTYPLEVIRRKMQLERVIAAREIAANPAASAIVHAVCSTLCNYSSMHVCMASRQRSGGNARQGPCASLVKKLRGTLCIDLRQPGPPPLNSGYMQGRTSFRKRLAMAIQMTTKDYGLRGLYAGIAPNALQVLPSAALGYYVYELMRVVLDVRE